MIDFFFYLGCIFVIGFGIFVAFLMVEENTEVEKQIRKRTCKKKIPNRL